MDKMSPTGNFDTHISAVKIYLLPKSGPISVLENGEEKKSAFVCQGG